MLNLIYSFFIISFRYFFITYYFSNLIKINNNDFISFVFKLISWSTFSRLSNNSLSSIISNNFFRSFNYLSISLFITFKSVFFFRIVRSVFYIQFIPINMSRFMSVIHVTILLTSLSILIHPITVLFSRTFSFVTIYVHLPNTDLMSNPFF